MAEHLFGRAWPRIDGLIAETASEPAGYAIFYGVYSRSGRARFSGSRTCSCASASRGLGVGRALIAEVARLGVERGCARMDWAVLDWNREAIGFYERLGARRGEGWYTYQLGRADARAGRAAEGTERGALRERYVKPASRDARSPEATKTGSGRTRGDSPQPDR